MTETSDRKPITADVPLDKAWKTGRRIYIVAGYKSQLSDELWGLGAKWDREVRALWVGSGKLEQVLPLIAAQAARVEQTLAVKAEARWVDIPFAAADIRTAAKAAGARWDRERKQWAMPTDEAHADITRQVAAWKAEQAEQRTAARAQRQAAAARTPEEIITAAGRTGTGETGKAEGQLHGRMRRPQAEAAKPQIGEVRRLRTGERVVVLESRVDFWSQDAVDDQAPHLEPGWYYVYRYAVVEPTADEHADDARQRAEQADRDEIDAAFAAARQTVQPTEPGTPAPTGPRITKEGGSSGAGFRDGQLTLTDAGVLHWYHPGYYDDYRSTSGTINDPELVERVRAIVAGGARRRGQFEVTT